MVDEGCIRTGMAFPLDVDSWHPHITLLGHIQYKLPDIAGIVSNFETSEWPSGHEEEKNASAFFEHPLGLLVLNLLLKVSDFEES